MLGGICAALLVGTLAQAADYSFSGVLRTKSGAPLVGAKVVLRVAADSTRTDSTGAWFLGSKSVIPVPSSDPGGMKIVVSGSRLTVLAEGWDAAGRQVPESRLGAVRSKTPPARAGSTHVFEDTLLLSASEFFPAILFITTAAAKIDTFLDSATVAPLAPIPGGSFTMGSTGVNGATPHPVTVSAFAIDTCEVTRASYLALMGSDPSTSSPASCTRCPVESVTWYEALRYCNARSRAEGRPVAYDLSDPDSTRWTWIRGSLGYRLPTEAEWEFAAHGGSKADFFWGASLIDSVSVSRYAWYLANGNGTTHPVGTKGPNGYGLKDVAGNVWEWVWDWNQTLPASAEVNPTGPNGILDRVHKVLRGGSFTSLNVGVAQTARIQSLPYTRYFDIGFRVAVGSAGN